MSIEETVIQGMASILWGHQWANHVEEAQCQNLSGVEITSVMPPIPQEALNECWRALGAIEQANKGIIFLLIDAALADGLIKGQFETWDDVPEDYQTRFGECLAWMSMGTGVSWFDDHEKFDLKIPRNLEDSTLMIHAEETCEDCKSK